jgi:hypothetical protein
MLILLLAIVVALVAWSLHLMQEASDRQEFSLMLAGTLVAFSAAALVGVYFLVGDCMGYLAGRHPMDYQLISNGQLEIGSFPSSLAPSRASTIDLDQIAPIQP